MKDALGHGSNAGREAPPAPEAPEARMAAQRPMAKPAPMAKEAPEAVPDSRVRGVLGQGHPKSQPVAVHPAQRNVTAGQMDAYLRFAKGFTGKGAIKERGARNVGTAK